jgi:hypothetical protein
MKSTAFVFSFLLFFLAACNNSDQQSTGTKAENDLDAARSFIQAALEGNFRKASSYMLQDSTNQQYLEVTERNYQRLSPDEKRGLREASIRIYDTNKLDDSTTVVIYANSYKNDKDTLRVIRAGDGWLTDLKYLFEHDRDTAAVAPAIKPLPQSPAPVHMTGKAKPGRGIDSVARQPKNPYMDTTKQ